MSNLSIPLSERPLPYRWTILGVVWASYLNVYLTRLSVGPLAPFLKDSFTLSNVQVGTLMSAATVLSAPSVFISGWLVDRLDVRRVLAIATAIISLCLFALFFAPSYQAMFLLLLVSGAASGCIFPATVKAIMLWFPPNERATVLGLNQTSVNLGGVIGASLLPTIALTLGWRYGFLFTAICAVVICLSSFILYRKPPQQPLPGPVAANASPKPSVNRLTIELFKSRDIWFLGLGSLFLSLVEFAMMAHLVLYLKERLLFGVVAAGGLLAVTQAAGASGKPTSGIISDRLLGGHRKVAFMFMAATAALMCVALGIGGTNLGWLLYPVLIILGVAAIGWGGLYATMAGELGGKALAGAASGATAAVGVLGSAIGPPIFGYIVDKTGSFTMAWLAMALAAGVAVVFLSFLREHRNESGE